MAKKKNYSFSICLPVYKGSHVLGLALDSIFKQSFQNYEIIIGDDTPPEFKSEILKTQKLIKSYKDKRIKYFRNTHNLGYPLNLRKIVSKAKNDVIFLLAQDDVLLKHALQKTHDAFSLDKDIGVVTRPYFWFMNDIRHPVRQVSAYNPQLDSVLSIFDGQTTFVKIFETVGQLSGLAYVRKYMDEPINEEIFLAHIYPFASILKQHKCVFLAQPTVAVGIYNSHSRSISSVYNLSPTTSWLTMYRTIFANKQFEKQRHWGVKHMSTHFIGLVQIKNYGSQQALFNEIIVLIKNRWQNIYHPKFWFYVLVTVLVPRSILAPFVDWFKENLHSKTINHLDYEI